MRIDEKTFYRAVRRTLFDGRLGARQVEGLGAVLAAWRARIPEGDRRWLAYMLATAHHETGRTMQPMRETFAADDSAAIARLETAFAAGGLPHVSAPYWRRDADGKSWLGRGLVQLTHRRNYEAMSRLTGIDLVAEPDAAMQLPVSARILVEGMLCGSFTGRALADYFSGGRDDWTGARRIINGQDRAALVAGYGRAYGDALRVASG
ncbi:hypothetical protein [Pararhizobium sp.]|uniref:hypothetical protein n=1 Tax=Pararhizobium sp. TaxID=1977563 RepID=UPI002727D9DB|nr:hypothetical protein [Pararhizobium sp.]MDO9417979.1 hypothetical protein [Pararhizobium sp.]